MYTTFNMIRTQIYIPTTTHQQLKHLAKQRTKPMADVVREFIDSGLQKVAQDQSGKKTLEALSQLHLTGGPKDLSQNLDKYLYTA